jgi:hypothetical protein
VTVQARLQPLYSKLSEESSPATQFDRIRQTPDLTTYREDAAIKDEDDQIEDLFHRRDAKE